MKGHLTVVPLTFFTYDITDLVEIPCHGYKCEFVRVICNNIANCPRKVL
jgi:hypothetical protein